MKQPTVDLKVLDPGLKSPLTILPMLLFQKKITYTPAMQPKTMCAIQMYELFDLYLIDDYLNIYNKSTGRLFSQKPFYCLKKGS